MKSPFPGMDPYLERHWLDVHASLVAYAADQLNRVLPEELVATKEERVAVGVDDDEVLKLYMPDLRLEELEPKSSQAENGGGVATAPYRLGAAMEAGTAS